jgi:predicted metalloprotease with PDZ domain
MDRYVFLTLAVGDGYGGLEHRASTALICARADLPVLGQSAMTEGYRTFLGLCSHEYFHTWNVKRIKPAVFAPYDLRQENYTPLLWLFEGFTSYYDDLTLLRTGLIDAPTYLGLLAKTINGVLRGSGRLKQSVAESSFDAWTKYYRQDENASNAIVSYYTKGSLVGLCLDLTLRAEGKTTLDAVMRGLWTRCAGGPMAEADLLDILSSDYVPSALLSAALMLGDLWGDVARGMRTVTSAPAAAVGLQDRGQLTLGARADLIRVARVGGAAALRGTWVQGLRVG